MIFTAFNLLALFLLGFWIVTLLRNTIAHWFTAFIFSLFFVLQISSLYMGGNFIDYKFYTHFNLRDIMTLKDLYLFQSIFLIVLLLVLPIAIYLLKNKLIHFNFYSKKKYHYVIIGISIIILSLNNGIFNNIYAITKIINSDDSTFDAALHNLNIDNYISSDKVEAEKGKNIIVISLESYERGYLKDAKAHLTPNMRSLAKQWNYYDMKQTPGSGWTSASLYTSLTGLPSYFTGYGNSHFQESYGSNIAGVGHVLKKAGYQMTYFVENAQFAGTEDLLKAFEITDVVDNRNIGKRYGNNFDKAYDKDLFEAAKLEIQSKKGDNKPFSLFLSTLSTHNPNGIYDSRMEEHIAPQESQLEFMIASVDYMIGDFIKFIEKEGFLSNTVIYIFPDHLKMGDGSIFKGTGERSLYLITNASSDNLNIDKSHDIYQIDLPEIILNGASVKHNVKFFPDYIKGDKIEYINKNVSLITALNNSGLKRQNILEDKISIELDKSKNGVVKFGDNNLTIPKDTLANFITQLSFSEEMRLVKTERIRLDNNLIPPLQNENVNLNFYLQNDILFSYLQKDSKQTVVKTDIKAISYLNDEIQAFLDLPEKPKPQLFVWEKQELIKIDAASQQNYMQHLIKIPYNITEGFIEVEYSTIGDAKPFVILYGQPYSASSVALHDNIPNSTKKHLIRLPINKAIENTALVFRNWSNKGRFIIHSCKIIGYGYENGTPSTKKSESFEAYAKDKSRFIAHAGGIIDGITYTNSLEALNYHYEKGFRLFELDIIKTSDEKYVAAHDWKHWAEITGFKGSLPVTEKEFLEYPIYAKYTPLNMKRINKWFNEHKDATLVTDKINEPKEFARAFVDKQRLMMELFTLEAVKEGFAIGIKSPMPSQIVLNELGKDKVVMLKELGVKDIAISLNYIASNVKFLEQLKENDIRTYVYHVNFDKAKDEKYVVNYEMDYIYGLYADKWEFE